MNIQKLIIATHNGKIHCSEVCAIVLLSNYFAKRDVKVEIIRSRDPEVYGQADIWVDIGEIYDHEKMRYDCKNPNEVWDFHGYNVRNKIQLSSAGLIWRHYGYEILEDYISNFPDDNSYNYTEETLNALVNTIYEKIFINVDAYDNGIYYSNNNISLSEIVSSANGVDVFDDEFQNQAFFRLIELVGNILDIKFREIINDYFNFQEDIKKCRNLDLSKEYVILEETIPTIFRCLDVLDNEKRIKFIVYSSFSSFSSCNKNEYTIKSRRESENKFLPICKILDENILRNCINENDIIFLHKAGFMAKTRTLESALEIVRLSLEYNEELPALEPLDNIQDMQEYNMQGENMQREKDKNKVNIKQIADENKYLLGAIGLGIAGLVIYNSRQN